MIVIGPVVVKIFLFFLFFSAEIRPYEVSKSGNAKKYGKKWAIRPRKSPIRPIKTGFNLPNVEHVPCLIVELDQ